MKFEYYSTGSLRLERDMDGFVHCKTVPYLIVAAAEEGHYEISREGGPFRILREKEAFVTPPDVPLRIRHCTDPRTGVMRACWMHIRILEGSNSIHFPEVLNGEDVAKAIPLIRESMTLEKESWPLLRETALKSRVLQMMERILSNSSPELEPERKNVDFERIKKALQWMEAHPDSDASIEELAEICAMSRANFYRCFHELTHCSPAKYRKQKRIFDAMSLFDTGKALTVKEAAFRTGFKNEFHFSRCFRSVTGKTPSDFLRGAERLRGGTERQYEK